MRCCLLLLTTITAAAVAQDEAPPSRPATVVPTASQETRAAAAGWGTGSWMDQHDRCVQTAKSGGIDLVLLGDSIVQSFGGETRSVSNPGEGALKTHFRSLRTANMGIRGDRTQHVLWRVQHGAVDGLSPRWLVLAIGTNNLSAGDAPRDIAAGIDAIVDELRARLPHTHVLVQAPLPRGREANDPLRQRSRELASLLLARAPSAYTSVLDPESAFCTADHALDASLFASDFLHLQERGYDAYGLYLRAAIDALEPTRVRHVVFVAGDDEYRSEETLPLLAQLAQRELSIRATVCLPRAADGTIDPSRQDHIDGLAALDSADVMVLFTRFRALPDDELRPIVAHGELGRAMVGFRTATHAFRYPDDSPHVAMNDEWPRRYFGQKWIAHHGHFDDGMAPLTDVMLTASGPDHSILRGIAPFAAWSWLYHVDGGGDSLADGSQVLLQGTPRRSGLADEARFPRVQPVAWTRSLALPDGSDQRVFFTTLGHPFDFREEPMRRLAMQGLAWALHREDAIPPGGIDASLQAVFEPSNSGIGGHKKGQR
ncbi:MAG: GDSL-type esterase/lipase family protein [Planctomycetota bacterium]